MRKAITKWQKTVKSKRRRPTEVRESDDGLRNVLDLLNGDTFVFLAKECVVCAGEGMQPLIAYMGDAFFWRVG